MRKLLATLLTALMIVTFAIPATVSAANSTTHPVGSITLNGVSANNTYELYKVLDLESYDTTSGAYSYKVNSAWTGFFTGGEGKGYVNINSDGYVTWTAAEDDSVVAEFAKKALAYAKANGIAAVKSSKKSGDFVISGTSGTFANLALGYYLVDSSVGALCGLTTTNPDASINAKNGIPTLDKQVQEDSTEQWVDSNTADIGQIVKFRTTINVHAGAENYVLHDKFSAGLTYEGVTKVEHVIPGKDTHTVPAEKYTVKTAGLTDDCTFEVVFAKEFCDTLNANDKIIVYYEAMLNRNAIVAGDGNPNETWLDFGEGNNTTHDSTTTYSFGFDIVKTDSQNTLLDGAEFKIYDAATGGKEVAVVPLKKAKKIVKDAEGNETEVEYVSEYRRARTDETGVPIVVTDGKVRLVGFDNGTYYLEETVAPEGYNKLTSRQQFIIADGNLDAIFNNSIFSTGSGVHVVNKSGSMLPETGGMGTLLFTLIGGIAVLGAGIILFARRRVNQYE